MASGLPFAILESKLRRPSPRVGVVPRSGLVERLLAAAGTPVISVAAPAGYGKTTLLAQWAQRKGRVGWVAVDRHDNDPAVLLTYLAVAVDRVEPIDPGIFRALASPGGSVAATVVPWLADAVSSMRRPVALVLDHLELLGNVACLDVVAELAVQLPSGSQLALGSRARPRLPVGLLRAQGRVVEVGVQQLAMDQAEAGVLLEGVGVRLGEVELAELVARTEGWPAGLYLGALALRARGPRRAGWGGFAGDHRLMAGYLWSELLARLPPRTVSFLTRTSVLERMCGPLCDAVLNASESGRVLEGLVGSNLLVVPLDRRRRWYRYHQLFRDLLAAELGRREPELVPQLHARAAAWCEANGLPEVAIDHAQAAGDGDRVARLVAGLVLPTYASGRVDTVRGWLGWFEDHQLLRHYPPVAVLGAWVHTLVGQAAAADRWAAAARRPVVAADGASVATLPHDGTMESYLAMLGGLLCRDGVARMRADAEAALGGLSPGGQWRATALLLEGISYLLDGDGGRADPILAHAVDVATHHGALPAAATALAERALVAVDRHDWRQAETLTEQALVVVGDGHLDDYFVSALVHAIAARTALHRGEVPPAREHLARAARLRPLLTYAMPHFAVQTLLELVGAYLALDDTAGARTVLRQARDILQLRPDLGVLPAKAEQLRARLDTTRGGMVEASALTTAELRLLPLLSTHLSFRQIGERLHLSRHTVKSQAISVYRKLGVSSRSQAINRVQELGLLSA